MSETNPYEAPSANLDQVQSGSYALTGPRAVPIGRGWGWIADGFGHFKKSPGAWIGALIVWFILIMVLSFIPLIGQIALMLIAYVLLAGFMIGCRAQSNGEAFQVGHLFAGFSGPLGKLIILSIISGVVSMGIMFVAMGPLYLEMMKGGMEPSAELNAAVMDPAKFWIPMLVGMLFLVPWFMAIWFAPALIALDDVSVFKALKLSFVGCLKNILPFLLYGLMAAILYVLGAIPLLLGLLVVGPTLLASIYVAYQDIFID